VAGRNTRQHAIAMLDVIFAVLEIADVFGFVDPLDIALAELPSGPRVAICVVAIGIIVICVVNLAASLLQSPASY
jgi:hypothetical protein